jgi:hypothetical protein
MMIKNSLNRDILIIEINIINVSEHSVIICFSRIYCILLF